MKLFLPQKLTAPLRPIPASICPISVVGTRRWPMPRRIREAASVTTSEQTPPPNETISPRRLRPCDMACLHTASTISMDLVSSRTSSTSVETVLVFLKIARMARP